MVCWNDFEDPEYAKLFTSQLIFMKQKPVNEVIIPGSKYWNHQACENNVEIEFSTYNMMNEYE